MLPVSHAALGCALTLDTGGLGFSGSNSALSCAFSTSLNCGSGWRVGPPAMPISSPQYFTIATGSAPPFLSIVRVHHVSFSSFRRRRCRS